MKTNNTPEFEQLMDWLEGRLSPEEAQEVAAQVATSDPNIQADVEWLRAFYRASQQIALQEPPTAVSDQLEKRFTTFAQARRPSLWRSLIATLTFDSHSQLAVGVRTAVTYEDQRQLIYTADAATVVCTLQRRSRDRRFDLLGQLLPAETVDADLVRVQLLRDNQLFDHTFTDDLGEFTLAALPAGSYNLVLRSDQFEITIRSLHLSA
ncbi:MAG TPA: hypothetical protein PLD25_19615 [Chloroflexota bacterium]|nr:hypothetical protein [Chloroflexota bacterium]HUM69999.1 hypothetical protein [Chloroflexota bacterium]